MIEAIYTLTGHVPYIICDVCKEPITDAMLGMVAFSDKTTEGKPTPMTFLHKGVCDDRSGGAMRKGGWQQLDHFLVRLCHNSGLTQGEVIDRAFDTAVSHGEEES